MKDTTAFQTMGTSDKYSITVKGFDLCEELIGKVSFTEAFFLSVQNRLPEKRERELVDAVLVTLMEHGITANAIACRMTYHAAPDAVQGAMAAGLLGAGSKLLGAIEGTARLIQENQHANSEESLNRYIDLLKARGERVPGMGHFLHDDVDPRTLKLKQMTLERGYSGECWEVLEKAADKTSQRLGRKMTINADGAIGAVLSEMGIDWRITRGFAVVARAAGLLGHINDEIHQPSAWQMWQAVEEAVPYRELGEGEH
ncbi:MULTISPECIES: citryl-CoA lyase [Corynebacterium]|uniref:citryl-CoA lyase n=1 Tax=Corynebacterium TaxID=1716 RepID=UPI0008A38494|nr:MULTISPECIES: citryl-CoA lyase [Corynebacterium]MDK7181424.1 citryl-CoA lyase [Corynebacterium riegelii]OFT78080.1 hypothetical protein HMPREF3104_00370 [Corynebacterium sp. HMSC30G07]PLA14365.1 citryl-CoA lyase [Corynebacterium riegelii]